MSRKIQLIRDYYNNGYNLYKRKTIEIKPGVTVLVGCNGIGKTTLLHQMQDNLNKNKIPNIMFDNLHHGGGKSISSACFHNDFGFAATAMCSSEGENIVLNMEQFTNRLGYFVANGIDEEQARHTRLVQSFQRINGETVEEAPVPNERWILLDAVDSGLSIDNIVDIKEALFKTILEYNYNNEIYIIVSANEYEMARGEHCFDVYNGKYVKLKDYDTFRDFILQSKEFKNQRYLSKRNTPDRKELRIARNKNHI